MIDLMPFASLLGIRVLEETRARVVAEMRVREELCTTHRLLHGGALMAFADSLGGLAAMLNLPEGAGTTTLESKTNFLAGIAAGQLARGTCEPIHVGRATMVFQTRITREDGRLAGLVTQTQMVLMRPAGA